MDTPPPLEEPFEDETIIERIFGLGEMFPERLTKIVSTTVKKTTSYFKWAFTTGKSVTWILATTAIILVAPISIETERKDYEEKMKRQERDILLGGDETSIM